MQEDLSIQLRNGKTLGFAQYGDPTGDLMFYLHGWPSCRYQAHHLHELALQKGLCVIAPDRPGIGLSDFSEKRRFQDFAPVLVELAEHLGHQQFDLWGVSGGGPYVWACLLEYPQRVRYAAIVAGAAPLTESKQGLLWIYRVAIFAVQRFPRVLEKGWGLLLPWIQTYGRRILMKRAQKKFCNLDRQVLKDARYQRTYGDSSQACLESGFRSLKVDGMNYLRDWGMDWQRLQKLPYICHGALDRNIDLQLVQAYLQKIPGVTLDVYPEDGHYSLPVLNEAAILERMRSS